MEEMKHSPTLNTSKTTGTAAGNSEQGTSLMSGLKKDCLAFGVSWQEGFRYVKASIVGQAKKLKAKDEKEASTADLQAQKMQVEAADEADNHKKNIYKSM
ncbi:hypothetical protein HRI_001946200 [Hibiscus trionum]|uniref:Uncharacterized protein n=1 Tax=Hibiscus trionum TaxID=183268 RepID=A0A9W7HRE2_HIBTR|nr:hypothetical protein HRI_001946200 [Hibiscus trionum]